MLTQKLKMCILCYHYCLSQLQSFIILIERNVGQKESIKYNFKIIVITLDKEWIIFVLSIACLQIGCLTFFLCCCGQKTNPNFLLRLPKMQLNFKQMYINVLYVVSYQTNISFPLDKIHITFSPSSFPRRIPNLP